MCKDSLDKARGRMKLVVCVLAIMFLLQVVGVGALLLFSSTSVPSVFH